MIVPRAVQETRSEVSIAKALDVALRLFSSQGFGATSMREIAGESGLSVGNLYHHFSNKEEMFQRLLDEYLEKVIDPELRLNKVFARADFPEDLEEMASAIEEVVDEFAPYILLIYVDVIEFQGLHVRSFYDKMAARFEETYGDRLRERQQAGAFGDVNPMVAVMVASRWFFYFYTVEKCFGAPMHFGMDKQKAVDEFIRLLKYGLLPRGSASGAARAEGAVQLREG
jgi:AcrR family transcriptional regulator